MVSFSYRWIPTNRTVQELIAPRHVVDLVLYKEDQGTEQGVGQKKKEEIPSEYTCLGDPHLMGVSSTFRSACWKINDI